MKLSRIKNFVIVALVVTAIYQTGMLWLEDSTSHNIFYYVYEKLSDFGESSNQELIAIEPEEIIVGFGDKKFSKTYANEDGSLSKEADSVILDTLKIGEYLGSREVDWESYLNGRLILYRFPFTVSMAEYGKSLGYQNINGAYKNSTFDNIAILPSKTSEDSTELYFISSDIGEAYVFELNTGENGRTLYSEIEAYQSTVDKKLYYLSAKQSGFNIFGQYAFIPKWSGDEFNYTVPDCSLSYTVNGKVDEALLNKGVDGYFSNFATKQMNVSDGVYTFSNQDTVVKYHKDGILEYYNYNVTDSSQEQTLATAYTVCRNFLKSDIGLKSDLKLKNVELKNEGLVFYFDYLFNDTDIEFSQELKDSLGITNAVEVVISNNSVKKCRRVAYDFTESAKTSAVSVDFSTALSSVMSSANMSGNVTEVQDMRLAYKVDGQGLANMLWYVTVDGTKYETDTKNNTVFPDETSELKG